MLSALLKSKTSCKMRREKNDHELWLRSCYKWIWFFFFFLNRRSNNNYNNDTAVKMKLIIIKTKTTNNSNWLKWKIELYKMYWYWVRLAHSKQVIRFFLDSIRFIQNAYLICWLTVNGIYWNWFTFPCNTQSKKKSEIIKTR